MTEGDFDHAESTAAFGVLEDIVREWHSTGRMTTAAGLKPALQRKIDGFNERNFGFERFSDFLDAAEASGHIRRIQGDQGPALFTPSEAESPTPRTSESPEGQNFLFRNGKVRADLWAAFVEWRESHHRLWDREESRSFVFPVDADGHPVWVDHPERFVEISGVSRETQQSWMKAWAESQPATIRADLLLSLEPTAPLGEFKRTLTRLNLSIAWREELQKNVAGVVSRWAGENNIGSFAFTETQSSTLRSGSDRATTTRSPLKDKNLAPTLDRISTTHEESLRTFIHAAVDAMSLSELAALPIRAGLFESTIKSQRR